MSYHYDKRKHPKHALDPKRHREQLWRQEHDAGGFRCAHCKVWVVINDYIGTSNRNHCNICLWSRHVDIKKGDRRATCQGGMKPVGLTFKHEGLGRQGELMLIHECMSCDKISINRIARDDGNEDVLAIYVLPIADGLRQRLQQEAIRVLDETDKPEIMRQLFGAS